MSRLPLSSSTVFVLSLLAVGCSDDETTGGGGTGASPNSTGTGAADVGGAGGEGASTAGGAGGSPLVGGFGGDGGSGGSGVVDPWAGPVESLKELNLGEQDIGSSIKFTIPDRVLGITTLSQTTDPGYMGVYTFRPPSSQNIVFDFAIPNTGLAAFIDHKALNAGNPQSDLPQAFPIKVGNWTMRLQAEETVTKATTRVWVRRTLDGAFHGGVVDFHVRISPNADASQNSITTTLNKLFNNYYKPAIGLSLGNVTFGTLSQSSDVVSSRNELESLLSSSSGSAPAINLFVVGAFTGELGDNTLGIAGGIPATTTIPGTHRSGLVFAPVGNTDYDASVLAHEIGHVAGLFHTTEISVTAADPLGDTPICPTATLNQNPTNCPDVGNVMFPVAYGGGSLTALQARVVQGSTIYRGILSAGTPPSDPLSFGPDGDLGTDASDVIVERVLSPHGERAAETQLERVLSGYICARHGEEAAFYDAIERSASAPSASELLQIAGDESLFVIPRVRAMALLERAATTDYQAREALLVLARSLFVNNTTPRRVRVAALEVIDRFLPAELLVLTRQLAAPSDPIFVESLARISQ